MSELTRVCRHLVAVAGPPATTAVGSVGGGRRVVVNLGVVLAALVTTSAAAGEEDDDGAKEQADGGSQECPQRDAVVGVTVAVTVVIVVVDVAANDCEHNPVADESHNGDDKGGTRHKGSEERTEHASADGQDEGDE